MADAVLEAQTRSGRGSADAGRTRREGRIPAVVYGLGTQTTAITVPERELERILHTASGGNTLISLSVDGKALTTLARQIQRHPVRHNIQHVDFIQVDVDIAVAAEVPLHLVGEPEGVKDGGRLEQMLFTLSIEAKPADIPTVIEADVSSLKLSGQLHVSDIVAPTGVTITDEPGELAAVVGVPRGLGAEEGAPAEGEAAPSTES
ncbi:MAG: 50S ribosomal protein L25 [Acidimicrobiia bacterium]